MFSCTTEEFADHTDAHDGICLECGEWQEGVEPDAEDYTCDACGEDKVVGAEQALLLGKLQF